MGYQRKPVSRLDQPRSLLEEVLRDRGVTLPGLLPTRRGVADSGAPEQIGGGIWRAHVFRLWREIEQLPNPAGAPGGSMLIKPSPMAELTYPADEIRMIGAAGKKSR